MAVRTRTVSWRYGVALRCVVPPVRYMDPQAPPLCMGEHVFVWVVVTTASGQDEVQPYNLLDALAVARNNAYRLQALLPSRLVAMVGRQLDRLVAAGEEQLVFGGMRITGRE